jgi:hypothetical protein
LKVFFALYIAVMKSSVFIRHPLICRDFAEN